MNINSTTNMKSIFFWNIAGSISNSISSVVLLMVVTRTTNDISGDIFSMAFAIAQQMVTIGMFQVRNFQATDIKEKFEFKEYFVFRFITCAAMIGTSISFVFLKGYSLNKSAIIILICAYKMIDAFSDVFQGLFQQKERLDLAGKALTIRTIVSMLVFGSVLLLSNNLFMGCLAILISSFLCVLFYDMQQYKKFADLNLQKDRIKYYFTSCNKILLLCVPLFINGFLIMAIYNTPKNALDAAIERDILQTGILTYYNILFMPASVINLLMIFLRPYITMMAVSWTNKETKRFYNLIIKMVVSIGGFSVCALLGAYILGIPILGFLYQKDLSIYKSTLVIIMLGGAFSSLATVFDNIITVIRMQKILVVSYLATFILIKISAHLFIEKYAIMGAALSFCSAMFLLFVFNFIIFMIGLKKSKENKGKVVRA